MTDLSDTVDGELISALVDSERAEALKTESIDFASITLSLRQLCDLELMANGGFSPVRGFLDEKDTGVCARFDAFYRTVPYGYAHHIRCRCRGSRAHSIR